MKKLLEIFCWVVAVFVVLLDGAIFGAAHPSWFLNQPQGQIAATSTVESGEMCVSISCAGNPQCDFTNPKNEIPCSDAIKLGPVWDKNGMHPQGSILATTTIYQ
jgi:hypothetical protein